MTSAEYRALQPGKAPPKAQKGTATPRKPPAPPKEPRAPQAALETGETASSGIPALPQAETRLIGPYALSLADPRHFPGRHRHTITGPATDGLTDALEAALYEFHRLTQLHPCVTASTIETPTKS